MNYTGQSYGIPCRKPGSSEYIHDTSPHQTAVTPARRFLQIAYSTRSCVRRVATRFTSITNRSTRTTYTPSSDMRTSSGVTYEYDDTVDMDVIHIIMEHVAGRCTCRLAASTHCSLGHCTICIGLRMSSCVCLHMYLNLFYICLPSFPSPIRHLSI